MVQDEWGNFVWRTNKSPRAFVHFLGGAFVGAAPALAYSQLLSDLADEGYVVLATPYKLQFDYLQLCDEVLTATEPTYRQLCDEYGELPLIGVGHSCGALLHLLSSSVFRTTGGFADVPRRANVFVSFNNKRASDAIPLFGTLVAPAAASLLQLEQRALFAPLLQTAAVARAQLELLAARGGAKAEEGGVEDGSPAARAKELAAMAVQLLPVVEQVTPILREIDGGRTEFTPSPPDTRGAAAMLYVANETLVRRARLRTLGTRPTGAQCATVAPLSASSQRPPPAARSCASRTTRSTRARSSPPRCRAAAACS